MNNTIPASSDAIFPRLKAKYGPVKYVIIHVEQGTHQGTIATFKQGSPPRKVPTAAHYLISKKGDITQMVDDDKCCYHAGNFSYNHTSIGIEHEGYVADETFSEELYAASAKVTAVMCRKFSIPVDRQHILGHSEVPRATHTDPGPNWDWDHYMDLVLKS